MKTVSIFTRVFLLACLWTGVFLGIAGFAGGQAFEKDPSILDKMSENKNWQIRIGGMSKKFPGNYIETKNLWTFPATAKQVRIKIVNGNISIKKTAGAEINVTAVGGLDSDLAPQLIESSQDGETLTLQEPEKGTRGLSLNIEVPASLIATFDIATISGDVVLENIQAKEINLKAVSGDMTLKHVVAEKLNYGGVSSDLEAEDCDIETVIGKTVSGDVEFKSLKPASFDLITGSGDLKLQLPKSDEFQFQLQAVSGKVRNSQVSPGSGKRLVKLSTTSGDIEIQ